MSIVKSLGIDMNTVDDDFVCDLCEENFVTYETLPPERQRRVLDYYKKNYGAKFDGDDVNDYDEYEIIQYLSEEGYRINP